VLIGLGGAIVGLLATGLVLDTVVSLSPADLPFRDAVSIDGHVLATGLVLALVGGLLTGLLPAFRTGRAGVGAGLNDRSARSGLLDGRGAGGRMAVIAQVALATLLLTAAGVLVTSFGRAIRVDPGVRTDHILTASVTLSRDRYGDTADQLAFFDRALERLNVLPGVQGAAVSLFAPLRGGLPFGLSRSPETPAAETELPADIYPVSPTYFSIMGIEVLEGRGIRQSDDADAEPVVVLSRQAARTYWPDGSAVGRMLYYGGTGYRVVGVVSDVRQSGLLEEQRPLAYFPFHQYPFNAGSFILRTVGDPMHTAPELRAIVQALDPELPVDRVETLADAVWSSLAEPRFYAVLVGTFGVLALLLASAGVYAVVLLAVRRRLFEFGVRAALGARPTENLGLVLRQGLVMGALGVLTGSLAARAVVDLLAGVLYQTDPHAPAVAVFAAVLMLIATVTATLSPAMAAARVDPVEALRAD
jgi:predicted permease